MSSYHPKIQTQGFGQSETKARMEASRVCLEELSGPEYVFNPIKEAVGEPDRNRASAQLHELVQKKLIPEPDFEFSEERNEDGTLMWSCQIRIEGVEKTFVHTALDKKMAKREFTYDMLLFLRAYFLHK